MNTSLSKGNTMKLFALLIALSSLTFGCSSIDGMSPKERNLAYKNYIESQKLESINKIRSFRFRGWQSLTNDFLIISTAVRKKYLVEVSSYCGDLSFANAINIHRSTGSSLQTKFDSISTTDEPRLKCRIDAIYPINKAQAKEIHAIGKPVEELKEEPKEEVEE
jgi:hypothetical protein